MQMMGFQAAQFQGLIGSSFFFCVNQYALIGHVRIIAGGVIGVATAMGNKFGKLGHADPTGFARLHSWA